jgi:hypothetical protein
VILRTLILFPSIAVDAPAAEWRNAMGDTKGHTWRVLFTLFCTMLPLIVFSFFQLWLLKMEMSWTIRIVTGVMQALVSVIVISVLAAMASHLYAAYAERVGRPPGVARQAAPA